MAISFFDADTPDFTDEADATSYLTASWSPPSSGLIFLYVWGRATGGSPQPTVTGNGITWTAIASSNAGSTSRRLTLFGANASGSTTGQTTIDFGAVTQSRMTAAFAYATGVDLSGGVAAAFVQAPIGNGTGTEATITLSAAGNSANRPISGWDLQNMTGGAPRTNWTELDDIPLSAQDALETQYRSDAFETTASCTPDSSCTWIGIAAELKAALGSTYTKAGFGMIGP
jgi:hypothetical protein